MLIVGAGSGTDVAIALAQARATSTRSRSTRRSSRSASTTTPTSPYQDPRVTRYINDGRAFLRSTDKKYDLVIFALPDSLTLVSTTANLRLESFLFTEQAFAASATTWRPTASSCSTTTTARNG